MASENNRPVTVYKNVKEGFTFQVNEAPNWGFKEIKGAAQMTATKEGIDIAWQVEGTPISKIIPDLFNQAHRAASIQEAKEQIETAITAFVSHKSVTDYLRLTRELEAEAPARKR